MVALNELLLI